MTTDSHRGPSHEMRRTNGRGIYQWTHRDSDGQVKSSQLIDLQGHRDFASITLPFPLKMTDSLKKLDVQQGVQQWLESAPLKNLEGNTYHGDLLREVPTDDAWPRNVPFILIFKPGRFFRTGNGKSSGPLTVVILQSTWKGTTYQAAFTLHPGLTAITSKAVYHGEDVEYARPSRN